jgi:outer membrane protein OmpA-like peptidoglycan-associated protein
MIRKVTAMEAQQPHVIVISRTNSDASVMKRILAPAVIVGALLLTACGGGPEPVGRTANTPTSAAAAGKAAAGEPSAAGDTNALPDIEDWNDDGTADPDCGSQDYGAGLVLMTPCDLGWAHSPEDGTTLVPNSMYRLNGPDVDLTGISGSVIGAHDPHGGRVYVLIFNSDGLFATGSDAVNSVETLDNSIKMINRQFGGSVMQVRGHTDSTGSASANQALSERRAQTIKNYLTGHGVNAKEVTSVGLGSARPLTENTTEQGRAFNRRVEIVMRFPKP